MRACFLLLLSLTMVWAIAFFSGVAYMQPWDRAALQVLQQLQQAVDPQALLQGQSPQGQGQSGEWYRVERTEWEMKEEARDGYLITSDSPLIRQRVRGMCSLNTTGGGVAWQQTYATLHRNTLALRRRINAAAQRHKEEMDIRTKLPLTPDTAQLANAKATEQDFEHYGAADQQSTSTITMDQEKYLVYSCLLGQHCGGWGDRMFGVMNAFFVALITDRTFLIDWELPPPIEADQEPLPRQRTPWGSASAQTDADLADAALRTYIEMVNGVKREMESAQNKRRLRRLSIARLLEPTNIDWRFAKTDLVPLLKKKDVTYIDTVEMVLHLLFFDFLFISLCSHGWCHVLWCAVGSTRRCGKASPCRRWTSSRRCSTIRRWSCGAPTTGTSTPSAATRATGRR
jgi:hypothetical protein